MNKYDEELLKNGRSMIKGIVFEADSHDVVVNYMKQMEEAIVKSLEKYEQKRGGKTRVMISYRNSCGEEVEQFRKEEETKGEVEIKVLPPGSLCGDYEAHTPMRRWMLAGLLDDHIREVDEVWVYYNALFGTIIALMAANLANKTAKRNNTSLQFQPIQLPELHNAETNARLDALEQMYHLHW